MYKIILFSRSSKDLQAWRPWLDMQFEVTHVTQRESLEPLLRSWRPHIFIYYGPVIDPILFEKVNPSTKTFPMGLIFIATQYDFRQEHLAFQLGADHYLLQSTPIESLKVRFLSLAQKIESQSSLWPEQNPLILPQKLQSLKYNNIQIHPDQGIVMVNQQIAHVTPTQFRLLLAFFSHPNQMLSREWLQKNVFNSSKISMRSIDAHISKLKKAVPGLNSLIVNVYGRGYLMNQLSSQEAA